MKKLFHVPLNGSIWMALMAIVLLLPNLSLAQEVRNPRITTNSTVYSVLRSGDTTLLGGTFSEGGYYSQNLASVDKTNDKPNPDFPMANSTIQVIVSDSAGGWYVGGSFSIIGNENRRYLAHVLADNSIDPNFDPNPNGTVYALVFTGTHLFVGGSFTQIAGEAISYVCQLDISAGATATAWRPEPSGTVYSIAFNPTNSVYVGGSFTTIAGRYQRNFAEIRLDQDTLIPTISANSTVYATAITGNDLYLGGSFSEAGHLANYASATTISQDFPINRFPYFNSTVEVIAPDGNNGWYVGGSFSQVNGESYARLVHILSDYSIDPTFTLTPNSTVQDIKVAGGILYFCGSFTQISGQPRAYAAKVDLLNGNTLLAWDPQVNGTVYAIQPVGTEVYLGGSFTQVAGKVQRNFVRVNGTTGDFVPSVSVSSTVNTFDYSAAASGGSGLLYMGGSFSESGYYFPYAGLIPNGSGAIPSNVFPSFNSTVEVSIPDGNGGWFVGGSFSQVGGQPYARLVHILSNYRVDSSFTPNPNSTVYSLHLSGGVLYVGGSFTQLAGQTQSYVGALNATTGLLEANWLSNPVACNSTVYAVKEDAGTLFIGGSFTTVGGQSRNRIAAVTASTGALLSFDPNANSTVNAIEINGSALHIGGSFSTIGGQNRSYIAQTDKSTGALVTAFNSNCNSTVYSIENTGTLLNVGGSFTSLGGQPRNYLGQVNLTTGVATPWNVGANATVYFFHNNYVAGTFTTLGGQNRKYAGLLNGTTVDAWNPDMNSYVNTIIGTANGVFLGGSFQYFRYRSNGYLSAFDPLTNQMEDAWTAKTNSTVYEIKIRSNTHMYVGGSFSQVNNTVRNNLAEIGVPIPGTLAAWNPNVNSAVYSLEAVGDSLYIAGSFTQVGSQTRNYAALLTNTNHQTSNLQAWNPQLNSTANSISVNDNLVALGGSFTYFKYVQRNYLLALDNSTELVHAFNPNVNSTVYVTKLYGNKLYVGGNFSQVNANPRNGLVRYTITPGAVNTFDAAWNTRTPSNFSVYDLMLADTVVYAAGTFSDVTIQTQKRRYAAAFSLTRADLMPWNPQLNGTVNTVASFNGKIILGGGFTYLKAESRQSLMAINESTGLIMDWDPNPNGVVYDMKKVGNTLFIGGGFSSVKGNTRNYLASLNLTTGNLNPWNPNLNNQVYGLDVSDSVVYAVGAFTVAKGLTRNYAAAFKFNIDIPQAWDPNLGASANAVLFTPNEVFLGGTFVTVNGVTRNRLASVAIGGTGAVNAWNPNVNSTVNTLAKNSTRLYVGGSFNTLGGGTTQQRYAAAFNLSDGSLSDWNPEVNSTVNDIAARDTLIFMAGSFTTVAGNTSNYAVAIGAGFGYPLSSFDLASTAYVVTDADSLIYFGGSFTSAEGVRRVRNIAVYDAITIPSTAIDRVSVADLGLKLYPNPSEGIIFLEANQAQTEASFAVFTLNGQEIQSGSFYDKTRIDLSEAGQGLYLVRVVQNNRAATFKVIVGQ